ncbi:MAG: phenylalanine--tRNA ligase subunit alpha [Actinomycetota bacterium]|nr:phenylalanine--tRNA ligase subunit alpha [Actinomycetota bacterium]MDA3003446.1 phenylalanine--tRNA ligase subunit alpha [Actinomycetota bacterium]
MSEQNSVGSMSEAIQSAKDSAMLAIKNAADLAGLRVLSADLNKKDSPLNSFKSEMGKLASVDDKRSIGQMLNAAATEIAAALETRSSEFADNEIAARIASESLDLTELLVQRRRGHSHIVTQATQRLEDVFIGLGFQIAEGPEVETDFNNFEALNMPKSHPARSEFDTMFLEYGEPGSVLLRTHTSPVQIRVMKSWKPPIYAIMPGRVFRRDTPDATHMPVFHQIEGLVIDRGITFAHLAGTIESFTKAFFGSEFTSRLRPSFFPFTEPSAEFDIRRADGEWIELGGCGMVHPNVLISGGIDPEEFSGFAFGFGIDRMAKERHKVEDIREMYTNDLRFLRQF